MDFLIKKSFVRLRLIIAILALCLLSASFYSPALSEETSKKIEPVLNNGMKWRIGYVETDPFGNFAGTFVALVEGLQRLGWVTETEGMPYTQGQADSKVVWEWLSSRDVGPYIEFVNDAHYSLHTSPNTGEQMMDRLVMDQDIDLVIAMGTRAGLTLSEDNRNQTPSMVFSSSNAVLSGIIDSFEDSGADHMWAHMDPDRYHRQIQVFHDIFNFSKLGIVYENSDNGKIYAAVDDVQSTALERGFDIVEQYVNEPVGDDPAELKAYYSNVLEAHKKLATEVDAMFLTFGVWDLNKVPELLQPFYDQQIPVFSQLGAEEVIHGALMSLARADFSGVGYFGAQNISEFFHGALPRELPQIYGDTPSIVINLEVAEIIDYQVPFEILLAADEIFLDIQGLNEEERK